MISDWDRFVDRTWSLYYTIAHNIVGNSEDAKDIIMDTYASLIDEHHKYHHDDKVGKAIVRHKAINLAVRNRLVRMKPLDDYIRHISAEKGYDTTQGVKRLKRAIKSIPNERQREALMLRYMGFSQLETADRMGLSLAGAKSNIHRGIQKIKQQWKNN